jgi:hypothetical protein
MSKYGTDSLFALEEVEQAVCSHIVRVVFDPAVFL